MTEAAKVTRVQTLLSGDARATSALVTEYLAMARERILCVRFPLGYGEDSIMPVKYENIQCELAARYFARRGGLGEVAHAESGVSRTWGTEDDSDLLKRVLPVARVG